jgi:uncharacterized protein YndB with AHSA1/START domain
MPATSDRIQRQVRLPATRARVWRALTDAEAFGQWFGVDLAGKQFAAGQAIAGKITHPGYEHVPWQVTVDRLEPERAFAFRWHPYAIDPQADYSREPTTLVEFTLADGDDGSTLLTLVESGFERIPATRRDEAFRMNSGGWDEQMRRIAHYLQAAVE